MKKNTATMVKVGGLIMIMIGRGRITSNDGLRLGDTMWAVFVDVEQYLRWREKDKYDVGRG